MSEKAVEVAQALLQELIEIIGEKPALAKRLVDAIEFRLVVSPFDPLVVYRQEGEGGLQQKLSKLNVDALRVLVRQHEIPCQNIGKRRKPDLIQVIAQYVANTDIGATGSIAKVVRS
jgi:hypothetical protein